MKHQELVLTRSNLAGGGGETAQMVTEDVT